MTRKIKYGIIGTGFIAVRHAEAIAATDNSELVMVYDTVVDKAKAFSEKFGCRYVESLEELLASEVEAVTVATPSGLHAEVGIRAAKAKKHILCEKPLEVTVSKAESLVRICETNNVRLSAVFQSRYARAVAVIKKAVDDGRLGEPVLATASVRWYRTPEYYANAGWRGTWALDGGGALMNQGIHTADLLLYFNGDPSEITGRTTNRMHHGIEVEDTVVALIKFKNGSLGSLEASTACAPGFPRRVELSGTKGSIVLEDDRIVRWAFQDERPEDSELAKDGWESDGMQGGSADPTAIDFEGHRRQISELSDAIISGKGLTTPGAEGVRAVELISAVYESARTGQTVRFL